MAAPNVPFCRPLLVGTKGADVRAHKRAISKAVPDAYPWQQFTDYYGERFEQAVREFQKEHGIQATGKIGRATHEDLERTRAKRHPKLWAFDTTAVTMAKDFCREWAKTPEQKIREAIVDAGFFWYAKRTLISYSQSRPFQLGKPPWTPSRWDCSGYCTACHYAGGAPDPNGRDYDHLGYTGTLINTGKRVAGVNDLKPGDLIFYGSTSRGQPGFPQGSPTHVALYVGVLDGIPTVLSNGSYPMRLLAYSYRTVNHYRSMKVV